MEHLLQSFPDVRMVSAGLTLVKVASFSVCVVLCEGQGFTSKHQVPLKGLCWLVSWASIEAGRGSGGAPLSVQSRRDSFDNMGQKVAVGMVEGFRKKITEGGRKSMAIDWG